MAVATDRFTYAPALTQVQPTKGSFFKRFVAALKASREAQAEREIARHEHLFRRSALNVENATIARKDLPF